MPLELHRVYENHGHDTDIYGGQFHYRFRDLSGYDPEKWKSVMVGVLVGGSKQNEGRVGVVTTANASRMKPAGVPGRNRSTVGVLETMETPSPERLEEFVYELAQLAGGEIKSPYV